MFDLFRRVPGPVLSEIQISNYQISKTKLRSQFWTCEHRNRLKLKLKAFSIRWPHRILFCCVVHGGKKLPKFENQREAKLPRFQKTQGNQLRQGSKLQILEPFCSEDGSKQRKLDRRFPLSQDYAHLWVLTARNPPMSALWIRKTSANGWESG